MAGQTLHRPQSVQQTHVQRPQGVLRSSSENANDATTCPTWGMANEDIFCMSFLTTSGSTFSVFADSKERSPKTEKDIDSKPRHPYARNFMAVRERHTKMTPGQALTGFIYMVDSCRDRLNASGPPESSTNRHMTIWPAANRPSAPLVLVVCRAEQANYLTR